MKTFITCIVLTLLVLTPNICLSQEGTDRDADNDGEWDYDKGGVDRDIDNDGEWDYDKGGVDRDIDNDGEWDY